jgi:Condensation domain
LHHIIADLWSMQIFRQEIAVLYEAFVKGMTLPLLGPEIQFADYALWERQLLADGLLNPQLEFWEEQFVRSLSQHEFHDDPKRKAKASLLRSVQPIECDSNLFARIKQLAKRENCTPFMVITAALAIVLHQLTGQREIRIGTLIANRRHKKTQLTIGHVMNTIGLCLSLDPDITFEKLLKQTREVTLAASAHQELPFEQLARVLETKQKIPRDSLFRILLTYNLAPVPLRFAGLTFASFDTSQVNLEERIAFTTFDIGLKLNESSTKLSGTITFDAHAFNVGMISSMKALLVSAIEKIMVAPRQLISPMHEGMAT